MGSCVSIDTTAGDIPFRRRRGGVNRSATASAPQQPQSQRSVQRVAGSPGRQTLSQPRTSRGSSPDRNSPHRQSHEASVRFSSPVSHTVDEFDPKLAEFSNPLAPKEPRTNSVQSAGGLSRSHGRRGGQGSLSCTINSRGRSSGRSHDTTTSVTETPSYGLVAAGSGKSNSRTSSRSSRLIPVELEELLQRRTSELAAQQAPEARALEEAKHREDHEHYLRFLHSKLDMSDRLPPPTTEEVPAVDEQQRPPSPVTNPGEAFIWSLPRFRDLGHSAP